ncbi:MAG: HAD hydrolase-like protein [Treponema sp.]|nr:HAD hydrolase-like protein [Treponema sp.]MBR6192661.1 HAD hydrolase-like protein [Treponema sp.]
MKVYRIPEQLDTLVFDIDGTLYTNPLYVFEQVDAQVRHFAHVTGVSEKKARWQIHRYRKTWSEQNGGKKISLGNTLVAFGIPIEESIRWRNTLLEPARYLKRDEKLRAAIEKLGSTYKMVCVTNNPVVAAKKTLAAIGVDDLLPDVVGLDTCNKSKPSREPLDVAMKISGSEYGNCLSVGDRYDIDLALPLELGMGGILVDGAEDIYGLFEVLEKSS